MMKTKHFPTLAALTLAALTAHTAHAELLAADGFDYPAGTISTEGGSGWLAASIWDGSAQAVAGDLVYPGVENIGANRYLGVGNHFRTLNLGAGSPAETLGLVTGGKLGADNTTLWLSFIGERTSGTGYAGISLFDGGTAGANEKLFFGNSGGSATNEWIIRSGGVNSANSGVLLNDQALILVKMEFVAGNENISLWANPDLSDGEAGLGLAHTTRVAGNFVFDRIRIGSAGTPANNFTVDEFRLGTSFADVVAVTTPAESPRLVDFTYNPADGSASVSIDGAPDTRYKLVAAADLDFSTPDQDPVPLTGATVGTLDAGVYVITNGSGDATIQFNLGTGPINFIRADNDIP